MIRLLRNFRIEINDSSLQFYRISPKPLSWRYRWIVRTPGGGPKIIAWGKREARCPRTITSEKKAPEGRKKGVCISVGPSGLGERTC